MVDLMLAGDEDRIRRKGIVCTVYDPCCGSGGMLTIAKEHVTVGLRKNGALLRPALSKDAGIHLFGQEVNPETWAVSKSDLFMKDPTGRDADNIAFGSTLSNDRHGGKPFDYLIANPPYGKDWKRDEDAVRGEHERGASGRFAPGLPRISDGQLLFLLHMLAHAKDPMHRRLEHSSGETLTIANKCLHFATCQAPTRLSMWFVWLGGGPRSRGAKSLKLAFTLTR
jgi:type I restriction enzyme M protein